MNGSALRSTLNSFREASDVVAQDITGGLNTSLFNRAYGIQTLDLQANAGPVAAVSAPKNTLG